MFSGIQTKLYALAAFTILVIAALFSYKKNIQLTEKIRQQDRERKVQDAIAKAGANTPTDKQSVIDRLRNSNF